MAYIPKDEWMVLYEFREFLRDNPNIQLVGPDGKEITAHEIFNELDTLSSKVPQRGTIPFLYNKLIGNISTEESEEAQEKLVSVVNHYINSATFKEHVKPWGMMVSDDDEKKPQNLIFDEKVAKNLAYFFKKHSDYNILFTLSNLMFKNMLSMLGAWRKNAYQMNVLPLEMYMQPSTQKWIYIAVIATLFGFFGLSGVIPFVVGLIGIKALSAFVSSTTIPIMSNFFTFLTNSTIANWVSSRLGIEKNSHFVPEFAPSIKSATKGINFEKEGGNFEDVSRFNKKNMTNFSQALKSNSSSNSNSEETSNPKSTIVTMSSKNSNSDTSLEDSESSTIPLNNRR